MPIAPAVLEEKAHKYYLGGGTKFMSTAVGSINLSEKWFFNTIHEDCTARVQLVTKESNPLFYDVISKFESLTGVPIILNTSFNGKGEPIVETVTDALETFYRMDLNFLIIGDSVISKSRNACRGFEVYFQDSFIKNVTSSEISSIVNSLLPIGYKAKARERFLLYNEYIKWIITARKTTTIRYVKALIDYPQDVSLPLLSTHDFSKHYNKMIGNAVISKIVIKTFGELTDLDGVNDGFNSLVELQETLHNIYGEIASDEFVTIYHISLVPIPGDSFL
ncbi:MAG: hypothetical protein VR65_05460 [Desulfobulbaceae bacterium BRH_c16a]|nr:MAG: hypothetical protein VR65_05460 [Desulfobulbaceae bacterium BRH_c16a]